jgi:hypothetical protein
VLSSTDTRTFRIEAEATEEVPLALADETSEVDACGDEGVIRSRERREGS